MLHATGAPHNVDETFAIWAGITPACSLWGSANKRGSEFGTMVDCSSSQVNTAMTNVHRQLYAAATKGDLAAFQRGQREVERLITLKGIQVRPGHRACWPCAARWACDAS